MVICLLNASSSSQRTALADIWSSGYSLPSLHIVNSCFIMFYSISPVVVLSNKNENYWIAVWLILVSKKKKRVTFVDKGLPWTARSYRYYPKWGAIVIVCIVTITVISLKGFVQVYALWTHMHMTKKTLFIKKEKRKENIASSTARSITFGD